MLDLKVVNLLQRYNDEQTIKLDQDYNFAQTKGVPLINI